MNNKKLVNKENEMRAHRQIQDKNRFMQNKEEKNNNEVVHKR